MACSDSFLTLSPEIEEKWLKQMLVALESSHTVKLFKFTPTKRKRKENRNHEGGGVNVRTRLVKYCEWIMMCSIPSRLKLKVISLYSLVDS